VIVVVVSVHGQNLAQVSIPWQPGVSATVNTLPT
jgi:hypothetical protein